MFCAPRPVFGGTERANSSFHVLHSRIRFWQYRGRQVQFSCFALPDSFSTVPRAPGPVFMFCAPENSFLAVPRALGPAFMFCAPEPVFDSSEGVESSFHVLRSRACFRRYRGCRVQFSCFVLPDLFSTIPRAPSPVFHVLV
jgi:hypothetical protein